MSARHPDPLRKLTPRAKSDRSVCDLTGEKVGTYTCIRSTGTSDPVSCSRLWLLRCVCERTITMSVARIRRHQRSGYRPRCSCDAYKALPKTEHAPHPTRCGACDEYGHRATACPNRKPAKYECSCCGLRHRVPKGKRCSCGNTFQAEPAVELQFVRGSSAAMALAWAPGSF